MPAPLPPNREPLRDATLKTCQKVKKTKQGDGKAPEPVSTKDQGRSTSRPGPPTGFGNPPGTRDGPRKIPVSHLPPEWIDKLVLPPVQPEYKEQVNHILEDPDETDDDDIQIIIPGIRDIQSNMNVSDYMPADYNYEGLSREQRTPYPGILW